MDSADLQIALIRRLFSEAERRGIPLWLESGWAIGARLGRVTRAHEDIDVAYPKEQEAEYLELLRELGFGRYQAESYGFLCRRGEVLLDSEPCFRCGDAYTFPGFPEDSCPLEKEGVLSGFPIRCLSWEAMYVEFLDYEREVPTALWREKDFESLCILEAHLSEPVRQRLRGQVYSGLAAFLH